MTATVIDPLHQNLHPVAPKMAVPNLSVGKFDDKDSANPTRTPDTAERQ